MMDCFLGDTARPSKPRHAGLTAIIDPGLPVEGFADVIASHHPWIDAVKFGWGTALVTPRLAEKLAVLKAHGVPYWFGGTLFERAYSEGRITQFIDFCGENGAPYIEISDGTIVLPAAEKHRLIQSLSQDFLVLSEIGRKDSRAEPDPQAWQHALWSEIEAGARWVIFEGRESGTAGLYDPGGTPRDALIEALIASADSLRHLFFEAPRKAHQAYFLKLCGSGVNLANIAPADVIGVETLRRGLRSDTFAAFPAPSIRKAVSIP